MVDRALREPMACRQAGVACPYDDRGYAFDGLPPMPLYCLLTWTVTLVGFVTTSYTAERF